MTMQSLCVHEMGDKYTYLTDFSQFIQTKVPLYMQQPINMLFRFVGLMATLSATNLIYKQQPKYITLISNQV